MFTKIKAFVVNAIRNNIKATAAIVITIAISATFPVQFAQAVSIIDGDEQLKVYTYQNDAKEIVEDFSIGSDDKLSVKKSNNELSTEDDMTITIARAFKVKLTLKGKTKTVKFAGGTVKELLKENGFTPDGNDEVNYSLNTTVKKNMSVKAVEVDYKTSKHKVKVPYKTKKVKTKKLTKGDKKVTKKGKNGTKTITYLTKIEDGKVSRTYVKSSAITKKPIDKTISIGTSDYLISGKYSKSVTKRDTKKWVSELKPKTQIKLTKNGDPVKYKKLIKGVASAYCTGTTCSTGVSVKPGYIAVDPNQIPYGSKLYIKTPSGSVIYGYAVAADTGGFVSWGNTVADLYMSSYTECVNFGRRNIEIFVL